MKWAHLLGSVLLVAGTTIGVGMLGLPVLCGFMGFFPSLLLFIICWVFMLLSAFFLIDVNCAFEGEPNVISMTGKSLGLWGRWVAWIIYLLLLYALMAAHFEAAAPIFVKGIESVSGVVIPLWFAKFLLPLLFGPIIYLGTEGVDIVNRFFMAGLIIAYFVLVFFVPSHVQANLLTHISWKPFIYATPAILTAFGYQIIIPTLATYLSHARKDLYRVVIVGSILAFIVNVVWQFLVLGSVPLEGPDGLASAWTQGISATGPLAHIVQSPAVQLGAYLFAFFALVVSFLGITLSLSDFLIDGLKLKKGRKGRALAIALSFVPPLIFVFSYEHGFVAALEYAGACVAILLIFLPAAMAWKLESPKFYRSPLGRFALIASMAFAALVVIVNIMIQWGYFDTVLRASA